MSYNYVDYEIRNVTKVRNLGVFGYKCEWDYVVNEALWIITLEETKSYEIRLRNTKIRKCEIRNTKVRNTKYEIRNLPAGSRVRKCEIRNLPMAVKYENKKVRKVNGGIILPALRSSILVS